MEKKSPFDSFDQLQISAQAKSFLRETGKWANFLSILGFIGIGIIVLAAISMVLLGSSFHMPTSIFGSAMGFGIAIIYILVGLLYFVPLYYLNRFANFIKNALNSNDNQQLTKAFQYLKSHYKFIGVFTLVILSFYVLIFLFAIMGAGFSAFR